MEVQRDVPFSVDEVTAEWLTASLRSVGLLDDAVVSDMQLTVLGEQVGFNGEVAILSPSYTGAAERAPASMVLKIPTASKNRILGQTLGLYEKEIRFYRDLQGSLGIRAPRHYYSALDVADDPDVILERMYGLNKLPIWLIRGIMAAATWFVTGHPRKYALLIEDLSQYRMGDQVSGCSEEETREIVRTMARLHAQFWGSEKLKTMSWIAPYSVTSRILQMRYLQSVDRYIAEAGSDLSSGLASILKWLKQNGIPLTETYGNSTATLLHGDFRLDNICFDDTTGEVILFDWQTMLSGPGCADLAYFISATLPADAEEQRVDELIDIYRDELVRNGVQVDRASLRWQYEVGMLCMLHRLVPTVYDDQMDLDSDRGLPMLKAWIARICARLENLDQESLLSGAIDQGQN